MVMGYVPTHPFPEASPDPNPTLTQTLDVTWGRERCIQYRDAANWNCGN